MRKASGLQVLILLYILTSVAFAQDNTTNEDENYRPKIHFTPKEKWVNDPNGMVYYGGLYHLFFQYHPGSSVWGPMHWGHATSKDLIHWTRRAIKIFPDSIGTIFSGSAVVDFQNTSGFGKNGIAPLVAIFTQHNENLEKQGRNDFQVQSLAFSLDSGNTWTKYTGNPVIKNPGIRDFRDPKVTWFEPAKKWVMALAVLDRVYFYSSRDLINWTKESEFGAAIGAHGGVWECPDIFPLNYNGKDIWVLIVSLNPGGPNEGSATQYFLGDFDGKTFTPNATDTKWIDYGPDNYAGITWSNTGKRKIFIGWMSNWDYAQKVPTNTWRNAMTIPRDMKIVNVEGKMLIASKPVPELDGIKSRSDKRRNLDIKNPVLISLKNDSFATPGIVTIKGEAGKDFSLKLSNERGEEIIAGYDRQTNSYYIDRSKSGKTDFNKEFAAKHSAPRFSTQPGMDFTIIIDAGSIELFADDGLTLMTSIFFPATPYSQLELKSVTSMKVQELELTKLKSIWKQE